MTNIYKNLILLSLFLLPNLTNAQIILSEIMFDPDGSDSGREWIEVQNISDNPIDISGYKLLENNINHKINLIQGNAVLDAGDYAIWADNTEKFLLDYPDYAGILYDSAFSLNNSGEDLKIIDSAGNIQDEFLYNAEIMLDDGHSIQFNGEIWISNLPTVGSQNHNQNLDPVSGDSDSNSGSSGGGTVGNTSDISTHNNQVELSNYKPKEKLQVSIGRDRKIGINSIFQIIPEFNSDDLEKVHNYWSLGNGSSKKGDVLKYAYKKAGIYNLVLNTKTKNEQAVSRIKIHVIDIKVDIMLITSGKLVDVKLINKTNSEVNLGDFQIIFGKQDFVLASDTILDANAELIIGSEITNFQLDANLEEIIKSPLRLVYPDGSVVGGSYPQT